MRECTFQLNIKSDGKMERKEVCGRFHQWTRDVGQDGKIRPIAIVEEIGTGQVFTVAPHVVKFSQSTASKNIGDEIVEVAKRMETDFGEAVKYFMNTCADIVAIQNRR